jgi:Flp pilus assembly protein TadG
MEVGDMLKNETIRHKGQALVELALVLPILILLLFGIIEFGRILNAYIMVSNASREAARYYSIRSKEIDISTKVRDLVSEKTPNLNIVKSEITINPENLGTSEEKVTVTVPCNLQLITPIVKDIISSTGTFKIESSTVMRIE